MSIEQKKAALKKVSEELDEAEEIVSYKCKPKTVAEFPVLDRADGSGVTVDASLHPCYVSRKTTNLQSGTRESQEDSGTSAG